MTKNSYKTIRIYSSSFEKINGYCNKYSLSKTELIEVFLAFFDDTKIDPRDKSDVSAEVKKLKNQLIGFIRTQEKDKLNPLIRRQELLIDRFLQIIKEDLVDKKFMVQIANQLGKEIVKKIKENDR